MSWNNPADRETNEYHEESPHFSEEQEMDIFVSEQNIAQLMVNHSPHLLIIGIGIFSNGV